MNREQALQIRKLLEKITDSMTDADIINYSCLVEKWKPNVRYDAEKRIEHNGTIYKVIQSHTSQADWLPNVTPSLYAKVLIPDDTQIYPWEQPESTNPYMQGDKVTHNGNTWISDIDNNVWAPGVYGWSEYVEG